jgi:hypothetical protein
MTSSPDPTPPTPPSPPPTLEQQLDGLISDVLLAKSDLDARTTDQSHAADDLQHAQQAMVSAQEARATANSTLLDKIATAEAALEALKS